MVGPRRRPTLRLLQRNHESALAVVGYSRLAGSLTHENKKYLTGIESQELSYLSIKTPHGGAAPPRSSALLRI
jgi:hypothetical protein